MISPLAVTSLAMQSVAGGDPMLGGTWTPAVAEVATFGAGALWGFALWWIAAATVVTRHAGRAALTMTAADWGFVFPAAAMVIATLTLGRRWESGLVEAIGPALGALLNPGTYPGGRTVRRDQTRTGARVHARCRVAPDRPVTTYHETKSCGNDN